MKALFSKFMSLPIPGKALLGMVMGGGIVMVVYLVSPQAAYFFGIAWAVVVVALASFAMVMKGRDKKKAKAVEANLAESAAASPSGLSKVEDRAALDRLRQQFEKGIQTFKDYGKDLYSMPWYVVVGEPGSGKTEAIRHSGIGFPPGLQDQLQGTGGTVNMNWWFTDRAVLLDTAGRLMFEEVVAGENNEWREFLRLLRVSRPNCPINGMLLVIPADTLITDTADAINRKAGKIAQQFDQIQRSLGVRFPVFVLITKADLINGFREFFDDITDPVLTAQMLGWSNAEGLDAAFRPEEVEAHLEKVRLRLLERRYARLQDPVHTGDAKARRLDQVDALYQFPEALIEIAPRLREYLEKIFVSGEWSQKPLFLRGIYFTSSMQEGEALDAALADALGVSAASLNVEKVWTKERAYFLKDVFVDKVFKESRLVTRAANAGQVKRKRSLILAGAGVAAAAVIGLTTWLSWSQTEKSISTPLRLWAGLRDWAEHGLEGGADRGVPPAEYDDDVVQRRLGVYYNGQYNWEQPLGTDRGELELAGKNLVFWEAFPYARASFDENRRASGAYALISSLPGGRGDVFQRQLDVQGLMFERLVLEPVLDQARLWLIGEAVRDGAETTEKYKTDLRWDGPSPARHALASLISMETMHALGHEDKSAAFDAGSFASLAAFADTGAGGGGADSTAQTGGPLGRIAEYQEWLYRESPARESITSWPPKRAGIGSEESLEAVESGVERFVRSLENPRDGETVYGRLRAFADLAAEFGAVEKRLADAGIELERADDLDEYGRAKSAWQVAYGELKTISEDLDTAYGAASSLFNAQGLTASRDDIRRSIVESANAAYDELIASFGDESEQTALSEKEDATVLNGALATLRAGRKDINSDEGVYATRVNELIEAYRASVSRRFVSRHGSGEVPAYTLRLDLYALGDKALTEDRPATEPTDPAPARLAEVRRAAAGVRDVALRDIVPSAEKDPSVGGDAAVRDAWIELGKVLDAVSARRRHTVMAEAIEALRGFKETLDRASPPRFPTGVPFSRLGELNTASNSRFTFEANEALMGSLNAVAGSLTDEDSAERGERVLGRSALVESLGGVSGEIRAHVREYLEFWSGDVMDHFVPEVNHRVTWAGFQDALTGARVENEIESTARLIAESLKLGEAFADDVPRAKELLTRSEDPAATKEVRDTRRAIVSRLGSHLDRDPLKAKDAVVGSALGGEFRRVYMPLGMPREVGGGFLYGPEGEYYRALPMLALTVLERESKPLIRGDAHRAVELASRFPVTIDAGGAALSGDELSELSRLAQRLLRAESGGDPRDEGRINDIAGESPRVAELIRSMRGKGDLSAAQRDSLTRASSITEYLLRTPSMPVKIAFFGGRDPENQRHGTATTVRQVRVVQNGQELSDAMTTPGGFRRCDGEGETGLVIDCPVRDRLEFEFKETADSPTVGRATLSGYDPLRPLGAGERGQITGASGPVWPLTLTLSGTGEPAKFRIGLIFENGVLELLETWPRVSGW